MRYKYTQRMNDAAGGDRELSGLSGERPDVLGTAASSSDSIDKKKTSDQLANGAQEEQRAAPVIDLPCC